MPASSDGSWRGSRSRERDGPDPGRPDCGRRSRDRGASVHPHDAQFNDLQGKLAADNKDETALRNQIAGVTSRIRSLESQVGDVSLYLMTLVTDLALHRQRLAKLGQLFRLQTNRLNELKRQYKK